MQALVALARAIDRHRELVAVDDEDEDRAFVELAGAFFATTLADSLGGAHAQRRGAHRLLLGRFGCFDPFAAIERTLAADHVGPCLTEQIKRAEAEARDEGSVGRVVAEVVAQLGRRFESVSVEARFDVELELRVEGQTVTLDIARLVEACEGEAPDVVRSAVAQLLSALPNADRLPATEWSALAARVMPRLLSAHFVAGLPTAHDLHTEPLAEDAMLAFVVRYARRARYLRRDEVERLDVEVTAVRRCALENLARESESARLLHLRTDDGPLVMARSGDGLDSSRLLLPGLHDVLAPELGSPFLAAVPHRDALYAAPEAPGPARALSERARAEAAQARHGITARLFLVHPGGRLTPQGA